MSWISPNIRDNIKKMAESVGIDSEKVITGFSINHQEKLGNISGRDAQNLRIANRKRQTTGIKKAEFSFKRVIPFIAVGSILFFIYRIVRSANKKVGF